jgi:protein-arginine kinase activator protein McsA
MQSAAKAQEYERAAELRDRVRELEAERRALA